MSFLIIFLRLKKLFDKSKNYLFKVLNLNEFLPGSLIILNSYLTVFLPKKLYTYKNKKKQHCKTNTFYATLRIEKQFFLNYLQIFL